MKKLHYKVNWDNTPFYWDGYLKIIDNIKEPFILVKEDNSHTSSLNIDDFYFQIVSKLKADGFKSADNYLMIILIPEKISITKKDLFNIKDPETGETKLIKKDDILTRTGCKEEDLHF